MNKIYRASTLKRNRRTNEQLEQLDQQIIDVLEEDHPQSVRHIFYRMTDPRLPEPVEKSDRGYRHVQERCVRLRRAGRVPYNWFADLSRRGYFTHTYASASDFVTSMAGLYRADLWRDADCRCEIWAESRSIASVILDDCKKLAVDLYPCGGFSSLSFIHEAATSINNSGDKRPLQVFYIGDYDPAGVLIDVALQRQPCCSYPLEWALSSGGNLTPGTLSALTGLGNNTNQIQITAPIQPGSSGSPVMDKKGDVVGMVSMKLSDSKMAKATGQIGQNVNFAVNGQTVKAFLDANKVPYKTGGGYFSREKSNADIAEEASKWTVLVECWK